MKFKLIIALVSDELTEDIIKSARDGGATGSTVISKARGEGLSPKKTFFGLTLEGQVDVVLFLVEQHLSRPILEGIAKAGGFENKAGAGMACVVDIEDAVGLASQMAAIEEEIEDQI
ncbi:MAG: P-II family nitrogen regulator [Pseudomonadota bacterium]